MSALVAFLVIALVVYFFVVKPYTALTERMKKEEPEVAPDADIALLSEIRDLLANRPTTP